jgi:hypothetical protein
MDTTDRIAKLPAWAREHIRILEMRLAETRAALRSERTRGPEDTDTTADPWDDHPTLLRPGARVRYQLRPGSGLRAGYLDCRITEHSGRRVLEIHSTESLMLLPMSTNLAHAILDEG